MILPHRVRDKTRPASDYKATRRGMPEHTHTVTHGLWIAVCGNLLHALQKANREEMQDASQQKQRPGNSDSTRTPFHVSSTKSRGLPAEFHPKSSFPNLVLGRHSDSRDSADRRCARHRLDGAKWLRSFQRGSGWSTFEFRPIWLQLRRLRCHFEPYTFDRGVCIRHRRR